MVADLEVLALGMEEMEGVSLAFKCDNMYNEV